ncbi:MAG: CorA family divalent cation transporter [Pseudomonadota bacterium]
MINALALHNGTLAPADPFGAAVWVDLAAPTTDERAWASQCPGGLPAEPRLFWRARQEGPLDLAITLLGEDGPVRVVCRLIAGQLVTLHDGPEGLTAPARERLVAEGGISADDALLTLVEEAAERAAARLSAVRRTLSGVSEDVFDETPKPGAVRGVVRRLGALGTATQEVADSLTSLSLALSLMAGRDDSADIKTLKSDVANLAERAEALDRAIDFQLNAALGLIAHDQNTVTVLLSITAALFLPPTLIASIFGMNFADMPGLKFHHGFLVCLAAMGLAAGAMAAILRWRRVL